MRRTFVKLMAMLAVLALTLTGCNMVETNQVAVIQKQFDELKKEMDTVLADYDGGKVTIFDAMAPFYSNYSYMAQMYNMFGMQLTEEDILEFKNSAVASEVANRAIVKEFDARGLTLDKTEEEIDAEVEENYSEGFNYYYEQATGKTDEEKTAAVEMALYAEGYTRDRLREMIVASHKYEAFQTAVEAEITEVTDEQIQLAYEEALAADEETYTANPTSFESAAMDEGAVVCWVPEGYRSVKHVLVIPEETVLQAVTDARAALETAQYAQEDLQEELANAGGEGSRTAEEIQADIDAKTAEMPALEKAVADAEAACLASVKEKTDLIYADLAAGKTIDEVMEAYGEDPGMQTEPNKTTGYYVHADSYTWDENFTAGAMALAKVGDYSAEPVISTSGVHIVYYNADVTPGAVALDDVRDALREQTLAQARTEHFQNLVIELVEKLNVEYHSDVEW